MRGGELGEADSRAFALRFAGGVQLVGARAMVRL
jgi:hypothetical protein